MEPKTSSNYVVILCGGSGPRLWPLSTTSNPKQFLPIIKPISLLQQTVNRFKNIVPKQNLFIISHQKYGNLLQKITSILPQNILLEPDRKNTTLAITIACAKIFQINPYATITTTPADHYIKDSKNFKLDYQKTVDIATNLGFIVTIGITPTFANPSFGYIKTTGHLFPKRVVRFIEKPTTVKAKRLIKSTKWYWNSGIYTFSLKTFKNSLSVHTPIFYQYFNQLTKNFDVQTIKTIYQSAPSIAFDKSISEKSHNLVLIKSSFDWSDVGEWSSIHALLPKDNHQISKFYPKTQVVTQDSTNCLVAGTPNKLIGLVGVKNLAIIDTPKGLLICQLPLSAQVRQLVAKIVADPATLPFFVDQ